MQQGILTELHFLYFFTSLPGTFHGATPAPFAAVSKRQVAQLHQVLPPDFTG
jgi:hypothetical protein